jgi:hypothetical protein
MPKDTAHSIPPTDEAAPLPHNRLVHQIINPFHHSFKTKWHSIIIQIFGRYGFFENEKTNISHCNIFNADIYRIHAINKEKQLDPVKLKNPFKWIEFFIVAPLEMFSFSLLYLSVITDKKAKNLCSLLEEKKQNTSFNFFIAGGYIFAGILDVIGFIFGVTGLIADLAVNLITGTVRRCLAPARYIVRPAIETAKKYPKSFASIVMITAIATLYFSMMVLTGGIPAAIVGSQFFAFTLAAKLTMISVGAIWLGSALTKGFNTVRELISVIFEKTPTVREQSSMTIKRNGQASYCYSLLEMDAVPELDMLDQQYQDFLPLFIRVKVQVQVQDQDKFLFFAYGLSLTGEKKLTPLIRKDTLATIGTQFEELNNDQLSKVLTQKKNEDDNRWIYFQGYHCQKRTGSTAEITRSLQNVDVDNTDLTSIDQSNPYHRASLWLGIESLTHPTAPRPTPSPRC